MNNVVFSLLRATEILWSLYVIYIQKTAFTCSIGYCGLQYIGEDGSPTTKEKDALLEPNNKPQKHIVSRVCSLGKRILLIFLLLLLVHTTVGILRPDRTFDSVVLGVVVATAVVVSIMNGTLGIQVFLPVTLIEILIYLFLTPR